MEYYLVKHQERAGHAPTSPTEARDNAYGGFSLRGLDAATDGRKGMNQMLKKKEPILFKGRLGWITVLCEKCGIAYDVRDARNLLTPPPRWIGLRKVNFDCPMGHHCEAIQIWNSHDNVWNIYDDDFLKACGIEAPP
jgi:hypothetical protein